MPPMRCLLQLFLLLLQPWGRFAALSVMPYQTDHIVKQLRSAILVEEKDLIGPLPLTACSSLDDGPFCEAFGGVETFRPLRGAEGRAAPGVLFDAEEGAASDRAWLVADGVLSNRMQARNKEAFDWGVDTYRTFSTLVSHVIKDASSGPVLSSSSARRHPSSQCFRLRFDRLVPGTVRYVPGDFSRGLPPEVAASWEGIWEPVVAEGLPPEAYQTAAAGDILASTSLGEQLRGSRTHVVLRTALGYIRFAQPVVVYHFFVGVPTVPLERRDSPEAVQPWGQGTLLCGRLQGREQWCTALGALAASAGAGSSQSILLVDGSSGTLAVDEVVVINTPAEGLRIALVEVGATLTPSRTQAARPSQRKVVMLRRHATRREGDALFEPVLATVSSDAAAWDLNDVLRFNMRLRASPRALAAEPPQASEGGQAQAAAPPHGVPRRGPHSRLGAARAREALRRREDEENTELYSFQSMLRGLKANLLRLPLGISAGRLKKEVAALVASTSTIEDEDVLVHSKIESLLQQRLHEHCLDGLLVLQARWKELVDSSGDVDSFRELLEQAASRPSTTTATSQGGAHDDDGQGIRGEDGGGEGASRKPWAGSAQVRERIANAVANAKSAEEVSRLEDALRNGVSLEDLKALLDGGGVKYGPFETGFDGGGGVEAVASEAAEAMKRAAGALEKKSAEVRVRQKEKPAQEQFDFQMDLDQGSIKLKMVDWKLSIKHAISKAVGEAAQEMHAADANVASALSAAGAAESERVQAASEAAAAGSALEEILGRPGLVSDHASVNSGDLGESEEPQFEKFSNDDLRAALGRAFTRLTLGEDDEDRTGNGQSLPEVAFTRVELDDGVQGHAALEQVVAKLQEALRSKKYHGGGPHTAADLLRALQGQEEDEESRVEDLNGAEALELD